ncbi:hypothetical protein B484DRAFT_405104, partial [Ochromonadaceae sp. CCMP2298]
MSNLCLLFLTMFLAMPTVSRCLERSAVARSLKIFLPDWAINSEKINKAQENYVKDRPQLLTVCRGSWVACSSLGEVVVAPTEESVLGVARQFFQPQDRS